MRVILKTETKPSIMEDTVFGSGLQLGDEVALSGPASYILEDSLSMDAD
jgi:hypothetical protein